MKNVIGLERGTVKLRKHSPRWKKLFEQERKVLLREFPNVILEISHGGSTAIPGSHAKPIIDMFAVVHSLKEVSKIRKALEGLNYEYRGAEGVRGRILYVKHVQERPNIRTHHLQIVRKDNNEWKNHLLIKNYYLSHPEAVKEYVKLKKELAKKYPENRNLYSKGKQYFIKSILRKAKKEEKIN